MTAIIHSPLNYLERINELYAFVSVDQGGEGLVAQTVNFNGQLTLMPFVASDMARMNDLRTFAKGMAYEANKVIKLIRLSHREELEVYRGRS